MRSIRPGRFRGPAAGRRVESETASVFAVDPHLKIATVAGEVGGLRIGNGRRGNGNRIRDTSATVDDFVGDPARRRPRRPCPAYSPWQRSVRRRLQAVRRARIAPDMGTDATAIGSRSDHSPLALAILRGAALRGSSPPNQTHSSLLMHVGKLRKYRRLFRIRHRVVQLILGDPHPLMFRFVHS